MEKAQIVRGVVAAVVLTAALVGAKMYQDGKFGGQAAGSTTQPVQAAGATTPPTAMSDPYANYSAPAPTQSQQQ